MIHLDYAAAPWLGSWLLSPAMVLLAWVISRLCHRALDRRGR